MNVLALRLNPGEDLRRSLQDLAKSQAIQAGFIISAIGSFTQVGIRFAGQPQGQILPGPFELITLNGTLSCHGLHLHLAIADATGQTIGGHVIEGCLVYTTAELVIGLSQDLKFLREFDPQTGFPELVVHHDSNPIQTCD